MKARWKTMCVKALPAAVIVCALVAAPCAAAGETPGDWRPIYDLVMRWINFLILVFVIVKFGRAPLMNFLRSQENQIDTEIRELERTKESALEKVRETEAMLAASGERFEQLTQRILAQGERKKTAIIEGARQESRMMIADAKRKADNLFLTARERFRAELVDAAIDIATERLAVEMTDKDGQQMVQNYMASLDSQ